MQINDDKINQGILEKAIQFRENGRYNEAIDVLKNSINIYPEDPSIPAILSHCSILNDNLEEAIIYLEKAKNINPRISLVVWNEARLLLKQRKVKEALTFANNNIKFFTADSEGMNVLGSCLRGNGLFDESLKYLNNAIELNPNYTEALINRGLIFFKKKDKANALTDLKKAHKQKPHIKQIWVLLLNLKIEAEEFESTIKFASEMIKFDPLNEKIIASLALCYRHLNNYDKAVFFYKKALDIKPDNAEAYNGIGVTFYEQNKLESAIEAYNKALSIKPDYYEAYNNMGIIFQMQGKLKDAIEAYKKATSIKPDSARTYNNIGNNLKLQGHLEDAREAYNKAILIKPDFAEAYWNRSGVAENISEARNWVEKCLKFNPKNLKAKLTLSALQFYEGNEAEFNALMKSSLKDHAYMRSFNWVFNLSKLPKLHFHRWALFDQMMELSKKDRPFYEFGVWRGEAFKYLIKTFKEGYGFDTFEGLPEDWHSQKAGTYSCDGNIPKIDGGEFIVGKFEDTLPKFFEEVRPKASIINFDADLYSSTICALNNAKTVIDQYTILIFDEFILNPKWEEDEYKALQEFCANNGYTYEVLAVSFFTMQVAVKLIGI